MAKGKKNGSAELWVDGACKGNPGGHSGAGVILKLADGQIIQKSEYLGRMNSNEAEYSALLVGLRLVKHLDVKHLEIRTDSELMHHQIMGLVRTNMDSLVQLQEKAFEVLDDLEGWTITHVPRTQNGGADILANRAAVSQKTRLERKYDPKQYEKEHQERLDKLMSEAPDSIVSQEPEIGTPWGSLGVWPDQRPESIMLMWDFQHHGFYVIIPDGTKLLWLGPMVMPPSPQEA
jgi:ribonuclease HI